MRKNAKSSWLYFLLMGLCVATGGCNADEEGEGKKTRGTGAVRPFGQTLTDPSYFQIGPAGGTVQSLSGDIEIEIPAGALATNVTIGLQAVENTAPNGTGTSYRLTPDNIKFEKPVTIRMVYGDSISFVEGLGIAYQSADGIWYWPGATDHDRAARKITVHTTHFSDWTVFESIKISPTYAVVEPGGEVSLQVVGTLPEGAEDDLLTPLVPIEPIPLEDPQLLDPSYIERWTLLGQGSVNPSGNTAVYQAPAEVPENNETIVFAWLKLKSGKSWTLTSTIIIGGSEIILNGGPYSNLRAVADRAAGGVYSSAEGTTAIRFEASVMGLTNIGVSISFPGNSTGKWQWDKKYSFITTGESTSGGRAIVGSVEKEDGKVHPGFIEVTKYGPVGGLITGTFSGSLTFLDSQCGGCRKIGTVQGKFIALRHH